MKKLLYYVHLYEDKMVQVNLPGGGTVNYSYDHEGKRVSKTAGGTTIDYYFDGDDLIIEAQGSGIMAYYTQGQGLISQRRNNLSYFYRYDGLGSTKALSDGNQNIQSSYVYDAWGNILQSSGSIANPYLYVGELGYYGDGDSGMFLLTQRWYNPVMGRFVERDPAFYQELSLFIYTANCPTTFVDPNGMFLGPWVCLACAACLGSSFVGILLGCGTGCEGAPDWLSCFKGCLADELPGIIPPSSIRELLDLIDKAKGNVALLCSRAITNGICFGCMGWLLKKFGNYIDREQPKPRLRPKPTPGPKPPKPHPKPKPPPKPSVYYHLYPIL